MYSLLGFLPIEKPIEMFFLHEHFSVEKTLVASVLGECVNGGLYHCTGLLHSPLLFFFPLPFLPLVSTS